jgi:DNA polymerase type B, organellar and viral
MTLASKRRYETKRRERQNQLRSFVAIDSEGGAFGEPYIHDNKSYQPHKSFLWGAGDINGNVKWLYSPTPLTTKQILAWLFEVKRENEKSIFISFAFGYDVAQLIADLPYDIAWELQHGKKLIDKDDSDVLANNRKIVDWDGYGFQYLKGKSFSIWSHQKNRIKQTIRIYDVFGFFQCSFLAAIKSMPNVASEAEYMIVEKGKSERGQFYHSNLRETKEYTRHELMILCRMMTQLRQAMDKEHINPISWYGAGSIAQALLKREKIKPHLGSIKALKIDETQEWAHHAFFGGRIELFKQGKTSKPLNGYDIASAYPAAATSLSSMEGGTFIRSSASDIRQIDGLSLVRLRATFVRDMPFYPLPYRTPKGAILFPPEIYGIYFRDDVITALDFAQKFGGKIDIDAIWEFRPETEIKPFDFLRQLFEYRASLSKSDITQIVIKLGINAVYGKMAQRIGNFGKVPALANPFYAGAITAWTRRKLMEAAMNDPDAIVMCATDGIISQRPLPLEIPPTKTFGAWEHALLPQGGVFVQSGVYAFADEKGKWKAKSRGFRPSNIEGSVETFIRDHLPECWARGETKYPFPYVNYMTLGAATASPETWPRVGQWATGTRDLDLVGAGVKRDVTQNLRERRERRSKLIATFPTSKYALLCDADGRMPLSAPSKPDWLDFAFDREEDEQEIIAAG